MKANELMIGDWVLDFTTKDTIQMDGACIKHAEYREQYEQGDTCEPIHLTEEILKANGWEVMGKDIGMVRCLYRLSEKERIRIYLHYPYMLHYVDDTRTDGYEEREWSIGNITYVHELQHALRLFGLNELADNFKLQ